MFKAIIFDLDNTLFESTELVKRARVEASGALINAGLPARSSEEVYKKLSKIVLEYGSNYPKHFSRLCREYGIKSKPEIIAAGMVAYHNVKISQLHLFPKANEILMELAKSDTRLALITTGNPIKQWEKIIRLNIKQYFDFISVLDDKKKEDKIPEYKRFMRKFGLRPDEVLCVGDRPDQEIYFGNKLGMKTVRILQGRHKDEKPKEKLCKATYAIRDFEELKKHL
ncbi:TIGR02253 family HAD-type hydrolase [Candidatus Woesearchaeota archaeon]|nr:TIGR02253 family HAD-type hydrolase [Candidatus Woesearchaeota archaeon]